MADPTNSSHIKDPDDDLPYRWDWSVWLGEDTIASATIHPDDGITTHDPESTTTTTTVWIAGGTLGKSYTVTSRVLTAAGLVKDWSKIVHVMAQ